MSFGPPSIECEESSGGVDRNLDRKEERGRGGAVDSPNRTEKDNEGNNHAIPKDTGLKRERKSRWGDSDVDVNNETNTINMEIPAAPVEDHSSNEPINNASHSPEGSKGDTEYHKQQHQDGVASTIDDSIVESNVSGNTEGNGESAYFENPVTIQNSQPLSYSYSTDQQNIVERDNEVIQNDDAQMSNSYSSGEQLTGASPPTHAVNESAFSQENNGVSLSHVPFNQEAVISQNMDNVENFETSAIVQPQKIISYDEQENNDPSSDQVASLELNEPQVLEEKTTA